MSEHTDAAVEKVKEADEFHNNAVLRQSLGPTLLALEALTAATNHLIAAVERIERRLPP